MLELAGFLPPDLAWIFLDDFPMAQFSLYSVWINPNKSAASLLIKPAYYFQGTF
jgi:hypothetical protein